MTREEHWETIIEKINLPKNSELKIYLSNSEKNGMDIKWYFKVAKDCLDKHQQATDEYDKAYYGINYDTYIRLFLNEMDKQGRK